MCMKRLWAYKLDLIMFSILNNHLLHAILSTKRLHNTKKILKFQERVVLHSETGHEVSVIEEIVITGTETVK